MMRSLASCIVVLVTLSNVSADGRQKRQVNSGPTSFCYYATWAKYSRLGPTAIDPFICTHLVLAFAEVKITGSQADLVAFDSSDENDVFPAMLGLKAQNPNLRVILAVGGWNHGTERFARVADNPALLRSFVTNTVDYLNKFSFDGLDVDWEFPTSKPQFTRFIRALKTEFDRPQNFNLILTSAMSAGEATIISGYDVPALAPLLDYMLLMSYDLHGGWEGKTGHNSPLFSSAGETSWRARLNTAWAAQEYFSRGMPRAKIVIGMTTYARRFTLRDRNVNGLEAAAAWWNQILNYPEVCAEFLPGSRIVWDSKARAHYAVKGDLWLSFDSVDSVREKTEWLMSQGYGGAMVWTLDQDDYANRCGQGFYPLLRTIKRGLFGPDGGPPVPSFPGQLTTVTAGPATTRTTRPGITTTTSRPATTRPPITGAVNCETAAPGNYPVPGNCGEFIQCANQRLFVLKCPPTLFYDPTFDWCNFEEQVRPNRPDCPWGGTTTTTRRTTRATTARPFTTTTPRTTRRTTTRRTTTRRTTTRRTTTRRTTTRRTTTRRTTTRRTTRPPTTTRRPTTTISASVDCERDPPGNYPVPGKCDEFIQCANRRFFLFKCPLTLFYDPVFDWCNFEDQVKRNRPDCPWGSTTTTRRAATTRTTTVRQFTPTTRRPTQRTTRRTTTRRTTTRRTTRPPFTIRTTRRTVPTPRSTTTRRPSTAAGGQVDCKASPSGNYAFNGDCTRFFICVNDFRFVSACPSTLLYDEVSNSCDWAFIVKRKRSDCA